MSTQAFKGKPWSAHPDIDDRNRMMSYLVNPGEQNAKWVNGLEEAPGWWRRVQTQKSKHNASHGSPCNNTHEKKCVRGREDNMLGSSDPDATNSAQSVKESTESTDAVARQAPHTARSAFADN